MKILLIAPRFHTNLYYRVISLQNAGCTVKVVVLYKGKSEYYQNIDIQQIDCSFMSKILIRIISFFKRNYLQTQLEMRLQSPNRKLKQIIKTFKPDVVLLKAYQNMLAIKTLLLAKRSKAKVLMLTQTTFTHIKGSKYLFQLNMKLFKYLKVYAYVTPIKGNYDAFKDAGINNVFYLPFVFPVNDRNSLKHRKPNDTVQIISVGKFQKIKDHLLLVQACEQLLKQSYSIHLSFYGEKAEPEYYNKVVDYVNDNKLNKHVSIYTRIDYDKMLAAYKNYDLFVLPCYKEAAGYSPVEALCNALPVICSTENGSKCYIDEAVNGYIFEAKNLSDLVSKMQLALKDNNLATLSENAIVIAKNNHSLSSFAQAVFSIVGKSDTII